MATEGQRLTDAEVREYLAYGNAGIAPPAKFDGIVVDATDPRGVVYRHATADEVKAAKDATAAAEQATADDAALDERVRAEATRRGVDVPPMPEAPEAPKPPKA